MKSATYSAILQKKSVVNKTVDFSKNYAMKISRYSIENARFSE
jgi:hypothetical protein